MRQILKYILHVTCVIHISTVIGQVSTDSIAVEELRLRLNKNGSHFIKATILNQIWLRYNESNPGTTVLGDPAIETFDIGLRRTRLQLYGQLSDHLFFYLQFGQNNFNYLAGQNSSNTGNRKNQVFFHDALGEYKVFKGSEKLHLGAGLTISNGLSRFSQPSVSTIMTMDVPIFAQATVDQTDEFSRKLSVYARGQVGKLDYRLILSDPFPVTSNGQPQPGIHPTNANFAWDNHRKQYQALLVWNFLEKESNITPYMTGTYLGAKKIFNLEAGFITQKSALWTGSNTNPDPNADPIRSYYDMNLWSVAIFYDSPLNQEKSTSVNAYLGFFKTDYGSRYLRYNGIMNPANGAAGIQNSQAGSYGNAFPMFGTGQVIYGQIGYKMKKDLLGKGNGTLMPYFAYQGSDYERLNKLMSVYNLGINWLIKGHTSKLTLDLQVRPVYMEVGSDLIKEGSTKKQVVLQYQIYF
ncbi:MAG: hypothetical protein K2U26_01780 [Cyclobacteriaceae bacterium]|nr:hypothetical protein [Cyclobacteriaceae bacterium]